MWNNLEGQRFSRLVALKYLGSSKWECICDCGKTHIADAFHLRSKAIQSCGCLGIERRLAAQRASLKTLEERFWEKVEKLEGDNACWVWTSNINRTGYGQIGQGGQGGKTLSAHRLSYEWHFGKIPEGLSVLHRCDNRRCVNPEHLFIGTAIDNVRDCIAKGRRWHQQIKEKEIAV